MHWFLMYYPLKINCRFRGGGRSIGDRVRFMCFLIRKFSVRSDFVVLLLVYRTITMLLLLHGVYGSYSVDGTL